MHFIHSGDIKILSTHLELLNLLRITALEAHPNGCYECGVVKIPAY